MISRIHEQAPDQTDEQGPVTRDHYRELVGPSHAKQQPQHLDRCEDRGERARG